MNKLKMGILGAGSIAETMALTIAKMPEIELHAVAARDLSRAQSFREEHGFLKAYGSYEAMVQDTELDLVYIATPHSHHYDHAMLCLDNGKHVLCEKAFTANASQAEKLLNYAREKKLLITEALWTRYMPLSKTINEVLSSGIIGTPTMLTANLGYLISDKERIVDPALAGGALLDLSVYPINFASMVFGDKIAKVTSSAAMTETGVDGIDSITLEFESGQVAVLFTTIYSQTDRAGIIYGDRGHLVIDNINNPERIHVISTGREEIACYEAPEQISGYEYEVESAVRAIREGHIECPEMPHAETLRIMRLLDDIRGSWGIKFPFED